MAFGVLMRISLDFKRADLRVGVVHVGHVLPRVGSEPRRDAARPARQAQSMAQVGTTSSFSGAVTENARWGGWGSNPRPRDYESHALTG